MECLQQQQCNFNKEEDNENHKKNYAYIDVEMDKREFQIRKY